MDWQKVAEKTNGAHFYWADLHIHTPVGPAFRLPKGWDISDAATIRQIAQRYVDEALKRDIRLLRITKHNDVSWVDYIREAVFGSPAESAPHRNPLV